ncbi:hypothetical protein B7P33_18445 [Sediminicola luteus]|uniref:Right handed beta helix domain-containing protein n=2 Tax=Sediminicola luteus TaxID=319238 RepID=A0A2A4G2F6_9FLAO|nr:hypothetical protein B7P33_18445 [Sediminicola luteus]
MLSQEEKENIDGSLNQPKDSTDVETPETPETPNTGISHPISGAFYVTTDGSSQNDGLSEAKSWSLEHAIKTATAGDVVYIKAGTYNALLLTVSNSGTPDNPITFMGYKNTPGDIDANNQNLLSPNTKGRRGTTVVSGGVSFDYKKSPSANEMPFLQKNYSRDETALTINGSNIRVENLIFSGYSTGIQINENSANTKIWNCIFHEQGNMNVGMRDTSNPDRYKGTGINNRGSKNADIQFCSFLNVEQNALQFQGAFSGTVSNNIVYSYNTKNGTDYMFLITRKGNTYSEGLVFENNTCERAESVPHGGHGFVVKNGGIGNRIRNFKVINTSVEVNFTNANNNLFENGIIKGRLYDQSDPLSGIYFGNGAHHNTFKNIIVDGTWGGVSCSAYKDGASNDPNINSNHPGNDNHFINLIIKNSQYALIFSESSANGSNEAYNNYFANCTFYNVEYGIRANRPNRNTRFYNSTFNTTRTFVIENNGYTLSRDTRFENCHFNGATGPEEIDNKYAAYNLIGGNPEFINASTAKNTDFDISGLELSNNSPLLNSGKDISDISTHVLKDFKGNTRHSFNIGAL